MLPNKRTSSDFSAKTLEHGLDVLTCFLRHPGQLSLTEIAHMVGRNTSSTYRLIATLEKHDFLKRDPENKKYSLGFAIRQLGELANDKQYLISIVHPHLVELNAMFNENATLYVCQNYRRLCIDRIESTHPLRQVMSIGTTLSLSRGAGGKVILAWLPETIRNAVYQVDPFSTEEILGKIRIAGYAVTCNESQNGTTGIAAPLFNADGTIAGSLDISGPETRLSEEIIDKAIKAVCKHASKISSILGKKH